MKKLASLALAAVLTAALSIPATASFDRSYTAPKGTPGDRRNCGSDLGQLRNGSNVDKPFDGTADTDSTLKIKLMWDEEHLYFLAEVFDKDINADNDIVEIYWDQNNDKDTSYGDDDMQSRFRVADGKVVQDSGPNCQNDAKCVSVSLDGNKYLLEGALTWTQDVKEGMKMGLEFMYNEGDSSSDFVEAYRWNVDTANGDGAPYADTSAFGTLTLGAAPVVDTTSDDTASASTADAGIIAAVASLAASGAAVLSLKKRK